MHPAQNKTACLVQLEHIPSGIAVKCQATRSQTQNRKIARQWLADKVEEKEKGADSRIALKQQIERNKNANRRKKARRKYGKSESDQAVQVSQEAYKKKKAKREYGKPMSEEGKNVWL